MFCPFIKGECNASGDGAKMVRFRAKKAPSPLA